MVFGSGVVVRYTKKDAVNTAGGGGYVCMCVGGGTKFTAAPDVMTF